MAKVITVINPEALTLPSLREDLTIGLGEHPYLTVDNLLTALQTGLGTTMGLWLARQATGETLGWAIAATGTPLMPMAQLVHVYCRKDIRPWVGRHLVTAATNWAFDKGYPVVTGFMWRRECKGALRRLNQVVRAQPVGYMLGMTLKEGL
jgi:hypothetical protein